MIKNLLSWGWYNFHPLYCPGTSAVLNTELITGCKDVFPKVNGTEFVGVRSVTKKLVISVSHYLVMWLILLSAMLHYSVLQYSCIFIHDKSNDNILNLVHPIVFEMLQYWKFTMTFTGHLCMGIVYLIKYVNSY